MSNVRAAAGRGVQRQLRAIGHTGGRRVHGLNSHAKDPDAYRQADGNIGRILKADRLTAQGYLRLGRVLLGESEPAQRMGMQSVKSAAAVCILPC